MTEDYHIDQAVQLSWARLDDWGFDAFDKLADITVGRAPERE